MAIEPGGQPKALRTIRQSVFWVSLPFGILGFALPIIGKERGASAVQIGFFYTAFFVMTVLLRPLVGAGLDRYGRRLFLLVGLGGYAATMFAFSTLEGVLGLVLARTLQGVASSLTWLAVQAIVADVAVDASRARSFGSVTAASSRGSILGAFIGFGVLFRLTPDRGWQPLCIGYGCAALAAAWLVWRFLPETRPSQQTAHITRIAWTRNWSLLLLVTLVTGAAWAMVEPVLMIFLQDSLHAKVQQLGLAFLPAALVWALLPERLGKLADRFGRKPLMILGLVVATISSLLIPWLTSLVGLAILWAVQALSYAAGDPAEQALVAELTGGDQLGKAYGLYATAAGLGAAFGPLVGGWLYDTSGAQAPFYVNAVILALCAVVLGLWLHTD